MCLQRVVQLHLRPQFGLADRGGGGERFIDRALLLQARLAHIGNVEDIRRARRLGVVLLHDERQRLRRDPDRTQGIEALLLRRRGDGGEFLAIEAHRALVAARRDRRLDARHGERRGEIYLGDFRRRPLRAEDHPVEPAGRLHVIGVLRLAGHLRHGIDARRRLAHDVELLRPGCHIGRPRCCSEPARRSPSARPARCAGRCRSGRCSRSRRA